ncbi:MAG: YkgJ family cysteine cluster protein [Desulfobacterales bacterium]|nr:YkgJ family cysteine cluster protein [Desulfobacterales bacterium]
MTFKAKKEKLQEIYERFERDAHEFKKDAICKIGCTYCCTDVGNVDIITLEGIIISERVNSLLQPLKREVKKKIAQNKLEKEQAKIARCPFLKEDDTCLIYDIRPFSCRKLYSIRECRGRGPTVHRQATELAKKAVREMQRLDDTGYSGHISFILYLLDRPGFRKLYLSGGFDPARIAKFGKTHRLVINRLAT